VVRKGQKVEATITLMPPVEDPPRDARELAGRHPLTGCKVANLSPAVAQEVGMEDDTREGVVVLEVKQRTPAARIGVRRGDIVVAINNEKVKSVAELVTALELSGGGWRLSVEREGKVFNLAIQG
jgi:serine protease Do